MILYQDKTEKIIQAFYKVYNTLGYGFLEKVYQNSLLIELRSMGFHCENQFPIKVYYDKYQVGDYYADIIVDNIIIIENKAAEALCEEHEFQLINYLKATEIEIGLLLNFGKKPEFKRKIFTNDRKKQNTDNTDFADKHR
jgi:GxxExxY protein